MAQASTSPAVSSLPAKSPYLILIASWLLPGAGHFLLGRRGRGAIIFFTVLASFVLGILLRGSMFEPKGGDVLTTLIQYGGFAANLLAGLPYLLAVWLGYAQPDQAGHSHDYGAKFLVAAGLLNVLAMVDAWEIAKGEKD